MATNDTDGRRRTIIRTARRELALNGAAAIPRHRRRALDLREAAIDLYAAYSALEPEWAGHTLQSHPSVADALTLALAIIGERPIEVIQVTQDNRLLLSLDLTAIGHIATRIDGSVEVYREWNVEDSLDRAARTVGRPLHSTIPLGSGARWLAITTQEDTT